MAESAVGIAREIDLCIKDAIRDNEGSGIPEDDIAHSVMVSMTAGLSQAQQRAVRQILGFQVWEDDDA
jgi:hypothetical protein